MKGKIFLVVTCTIIVSICTSCQNNEYDQLAYEIENPDEVEVIQINSDNKLALASLKKIIKESNTDTRNNSKNRITFNSESITEYNISGSNTNFYLITQNGYNENNPTNYFAGYVMDNEKIKLGVIIKEELTAKTKKKVITYYNLDHKLISQISIDGINKKINVISNNTPLRIKTRSENFSSKGDCIAKCMDSVCSDNGWLSVIMKCVSSFCPPVTVSLAMWCNETCNELMHKE